MQPEQLSITSYRNAKEVDSYSIPRQPLVRPMLPLPEVYSSSPSAPSATPSPSQASAEQLVSPVVNGVATHSQRHYQPEMQAVAQAVPVETPCNDSTGRWTSSAATHQAQEEAVEKLAPEEGNVAYLDTSGGTTSSIHSISPSLSTDKVNACLMVTTLEANIATDTATRDLILSSSPLIHTGVTSHSTYPTRISSLRSPTQRHAMRAACAMPPLPTQALSGFGTPVGELHEDKSDDVVDDSSGYCGINAAHDGKDRNETEATAASLQPPLVDDKRPATPSISSVTDRSTETATDTMSTTTIAATDTESISAASPSASPQLHLRLTPPHTRSPTQNRRLASARGLPGSPLARARGLMCSPLSRTRAGDSWGRVRRGCSRVGLSNMVATLPLHRRNAGVMPLPAITIPSTLHPRQVPVSVLAARHVDNADEGAEPVDASRTHDASTAAAGLNNAIQGSAAPVSRAGRFTGAVVTADGLVADGDSSGMHAPLTREGVCDEASSVEESSVVRWRVLTSPAGEGDNHGTMSPSSAYTATPHSTTSSTFVTSGSDTAAAEKVSFERPVPEPTSENARIAAFLDTLSPQHTAFAKGAWTPHRSRPTQTSGMRVGEAQSSSAQGGVEVATTGTGEDADTTALASETCTMSACPVGGDAVKEVSVSTDGHARLLGAAFALASIVAQSPSPQRSGRGISSSQFVSRVHASISTIASGGDRLQSSVSRLHAVATGEGNSGGVLISGHQRPLGAPALLWSAGGDAHATPPAGKECVHVCAGWAKPRPVSCRGLETQRPSRVPAPSATTCRANLPMFTLSLHGADGASPPSSTAESDTSPRAESHMRAFTTAAPHLATHWPLLRAASSTPVPHVASLPYLSPSPHACTDACVCVPTTASTVSACRPVTATTATPATAGTFSTAVGAAAATTAGTTAAKEVQGSDNTSFTIYTAVQVTTPTSGSAGPSSSFLTSPSTSTAPPTFHTITRTSAVALRPSTAVIPSSGPLIHDNDMRNGELPALPAPTIADYTAYAPLASFSSTLSATSCPSSPSASGSSHVLGDGTGMHLTQPSSGIYSSARSSTTPLTSPSAPLVATSSSSPRTGLHNTSSRYTSTLLALFSLTDSPPLYALPIAAGTPSPPAARANIGQTRIPTVTQTHAHTMSGQPYHGRRAPETVAELVVGDVNEVASFQPSFPPSTISSCSSYSSSPTPATTRTARANALTVVHTNTIHNTTLALCATTEVNEDSAPHTAPHATMDVLQQPSQSLSRAPLRAASYTASSTAWVTASSGTSPTVVPTTPVPPPTPALTPTSVHASTPPAASIWLGLPSAVNDGAAAAPPQPHFNYDGNTARVKRKRLATTVPHTSPPPSVRVSKGNISQHTRASTFQSPSPSTSAASPPPRRSRWGVPTPIALRLPGLRYTTAALSSYVTLAAPQPCQPRPRAAQSSSAPPHTPPCARAQSSASPLPHAITLTTHPSRQVLEAGLDCLSPSPGRLYIRAGGVPTQLFPCASLSPATTPPYSPAATLSGDTPHVLIAPHSSRLHDRPLPSGLSPQGYHFAPTAPFSAQSSSFTPVTEPQRPVQAAARALPLGLSGLSPAVSVARIHAGTEAQTICSTELHTRLCASAVSPIAMGASSKCATRIPTSSPRALRLTAGTTGAPPFAPHATGGAETGQALQRQRCVDTGRRPQQRADAQQVGSVRRRSGASRHIPAQRGGRGGVVGAALQGLRCVVFPRGATRGCTLTTAPVRLRDLLRGARFLSALIRMAPIESEVRESIGCEEPERWEGGRECRQEHEAGGDIVGAAASAEGVERYEDWVGEGEDQEQEEGEEEEEEEVMNVVDSREAVWRRDGIDSHLAPYTRMVVMISPSPLASAAVLPSGLTPPNSESLANMHAAENASAQFVAQFTQSATASSFSPAPHQSPLSLQSPQAPITAPSLPLPPTLSSTPSACLHITYVPTMALADFTSTASLGPLASRVHAHTAEVGTAMGRSTSAVSLRGTRSLMEDHLASFLDEERVEAAPRESPFPSATAFAPVTGPCLWLAPDSLSTADMRTEPRSPTLPPVRALAASPAHGHATHPRPVEEVSLGHSRVGSGSAPRTLDTSGAAGLVPNTASAPLLPPVAPLVRVHPFSGRIILREHRHGTPPRQVRIEDNSATVAPLPCGSARAGRERGHVATRLRVPVVLPVCTSLPRAMSVTSDASLAGDGHGDEHTILAKRRNRRAAARVGVVDRDGVGRDTSKQMPRQHDDGTMTRQLWRHVEQRKQDTITAQQDPGRERQRMLTSPEFLGEENFRLWNPVIRLHFLDDEEEPWTGEGMARVSGPENDGDDHSDGVQGAKDGGEEENMDGKGRKETRRNTPTEPSKEMSRRRGAEEGVRGGEGEEEGENGVASSRRWQEWRQSRDESCAEGLSGGPHTASVVTSPSSIPGVELTWRRAMSASERSRHSDSGSCDSGISTHYHTTDMLRTDGCGDVLYNTASLASVVGV